MDISWWKVDLAAHAPVDREVPILLPLVDPGDRECLGRRHRLANVVPIMVGAAIILIALLALAPAGIIPAAWRGQLIGDVIVAAFAAAAAMLHWANVARPALSAVRDVKVLVLALYVTALVFAPSLIALTGEEPAADTNFRVIEAVVVLSGALALVWGAHLRARVAAERAAWDSARRWNDFLVELQAARSAGWGVRPAFVTDAANRTGVGILAADGVIVGVRPDLTPASWQRVCLALGLAS